MITYFSKDHKKETLVQQESFSAGTWVHVENPTADEKKFLIETLNLEKGHIDDALDEDEVPRFEVEGEIVYLFTRFPHIDNELTVTLPFLIVVTPTTVVTITLTNPRFFSVIPEMKTKIDPAIREQIIMYILSEITKLYYSYFHTISKEIRHIRRKIERISNKNIVQFVRFEEILNDFRPSLTGTDTVLTKLQNDKLLQFKKAQVEKIEDIHLSNKQLIDNCLDTLDTIRNVREAYTTILSNNLNNVIKLFTSLTVILTIPTIIASLYGMNVALPFAESENAFSFILLIILLSVIFSLFYFRRKDWL